MLVRSERVAFGRPNPHNAVMNSNDVFNQDDVIDLRSERTRQRAAWRCATLDAAGRLLTAEGPAALTMRRLAEEVGASTTVLYTMFGGKDGLVHELYLEGFDRLRRALEAVPPGDDPVARLEAIGWAYRTNALANPTYYAVMFERVMPGFTPPAESVRRTHEGFVALVDAVRACVAAGVFPALDPVAVADLLWGLAHGMVGLERAGYFPDPEEARRRYALAMETALAGLRKGVSS
jgi:AcrR family transcriptional regulator